MTLFKSRLRKKIEAKRNNLLKQRLQLVDEKNKIKQTLHVKEYVGLIVKDGQLKHDIDLLDSILQ